MTGKPEHWKRAQVNERAHWERLISGCMKGPPEYGGEKFWLDLWAKQGNFLWSLLEQQIVVGHRILEIGGGAIGVIRWMKRAKLYAIDPLGKLFSERFGYLPLEKYLLRRDVIHIPSAAEDVNPKGLGRFDFIFMFDALDHCRDPGKVLEKIHAVLDSEGWFLEATTSFHVKFETSEPYQRHHPWAWTKDELVKMIYDAGFDLMGSCDDWPTHPGFKEEGANSDQVLNVWRKK